tara:strand:+ start:411 stop:629 length:219 start_codon:yes stop_codon:yes gene_type:complete
MIPPTLGRLGETSKFKVGDLVTKECWWAGRYPTSPERKEVMIVLETCGQAIKILWSDGTIKADLSCNYVLVS